MAKTLLALLCALPLLAAAPADEKPVLAALEQWRQATLHQDRATLERVLHDDLTYTHSSAHTQSKAEVLTAVMEGKSRLTSIELTGTTVRMYGNTAIVRCNFESNTLSNGATSNLKALLIMVWVKGEAGWQMVARQATRLPQ